MCQSIPGRLSVRKISALLKLTALYRYAFLLLIAVLATVKTHAQDFFPQQTNHGFRVGLDAELPGSNLKSGYKKALSYNLGYMTFYEKMTFSVNFSYRCFQPLVPVDVEDIDAAHQSITTTSPYNTFALYLNLVYNIPFTDRVRFYAGANLGEAYSSYHATYVDDTTNQFLDNSGKQTYFAPKIGANVAIDNYWDLDLHATYNMYLQGAIEYNTRGGYSGAPPTTFTSITAGVGLVYKF